MNAGWKKESNISVAFTFYRVELNFYLAERPKTSAVVARRLIAANVDGKIARQIRAAEEEEKLIKVRNTQFFRYFFSFGALDKSQVYITLF